MAFAPLDQARLSLIQPRAGTLTTRQTSLNAADCTVTSPITGLVTLGFDARGFPPTLPACYRASWQLPGPDSHRLVMTILRPQDTRHIATSPPGLIVKEYRRNWPNRLLV